MNPIELRNLVLVSEMIVRCAMERIISWFALHLGLS